MYQLGANIGPWPVPFTFPTWPVLNAIKEALPATGDQWNTSKVNELYALYKDAIEAGKPIYKQGQTAALNYMVENSNYPRMDISVFLMTLYNMAQSGEIDQKYWNIPLQEKRGILPGGGAITDTLDKFTGAIKWGSIALLAAGALYMTWPLLKKMRRQ